MGWWVCWLRVCVDGEEMMASGLEGNGWVWKPAPGTPQIYFWEQVKES